MGIGQRRRIERLAMDLGKVEQLVGYFQAGEGLVIDFDPGRATLGRMEELDLAARGGSQEPAEIPKTRAGVRRVYGSFRWTPGRGRLVDIDDSWEEVNLRRFELHTGQSRRFHRLAGEELVELFERACRVSGYTPKSVGTFNPRRIKRHPDSKLSMHAYGIAVDFDSHDNAWGGVRQELDSRGKWQNTDEPSLIRQHPGFAETFEDAGWTWGGRWRGGKGDDMHFERRAPR